MSTEVVPVLHANDIAELPPKQRGELITKALEEAKAWLAVATKGTDPTPIEKFRQWAATVAEMTRQQKLAKEIQLDAAEMERRAERAIGITVRRGQTVGVIATNEELAQYAGRLGAVARGVGKIPVAKVERKPSPGDFLGRRSLSAAGIAQVTDGLGDEEFEEAIALARAEENMSRRNLVRRAQGLAGHLPKKQRIQKIEQMAAQGFTSEQIADALGATLSRAPEYVREQAFRHNIEIPADALRHGKHKVDVDRVVRETVHGIAGFATGVSKINDLSAINPDDARIWALSLAQSLRVLQGLQKELKQNGQQVQES